MKSKKPKKTKAVETPPQEETYGERCVKCGDVGEDRRTLWMACFYAMHEMKEVPFEQLMLKGGVPHNYEGDETIPDGVLKGHAFPKYSAEPSGKAMDRAFYTLRVCKGCRSDWMQAVRSWFLTPVPKQESCGSGIFIRECGKLVEITEAEWKRRYGDRVPARTS